MPNKAWSTLKKRVKHNYKLKFNEDYRKFQCKRLIEERDKTYDERDALGLSPDERYINDENYTRFTKRINNYNGAYFDWGCDKLSGGKKRKSKKRTRSVKKRTKKKSRKSRKRTTKKSRKRSRH